MMDNLGRTEIFELMNKDTKLADLEVNRSRAYILSINGTIPGFIGNITDWIDRRTSPIGRANVNYLLKLAGIRDKIEYLKITHCISLTDTLWVRELHSNITWDEISPYRNRLSRVIAEIVLNANYIGASKLRSPSPEYTLDGSADKCWKREEGIIYLYKTSGEKWSGITGNRPYCEYYACQVAKQLIGDKTDFVRYKLKVARTKENNLKAYAKCPIFTSEKYGYIPIDESSYWKYELKELDQRMDTRSRIILREMLLLDSIILNYDRHGGNYGFIFSNDSYKIIGMAPIFDNDCSLGHNISLQSNSFDEAYKLASGIGPRTGLGGYIKQAKMSLTQELISNMRNMYPFHFDRLPKEIDLEDERIEFMEYIVNSQIKAILGLGGAI